MKSPFALIGSLSMALAIMLGAFAAHALKHQLNAEQLAVFNTAVDYHIYHSLALLWLAWANSQVSLQRAGWLLFTGMLIFSGSLYAYTLTAIKYFAYITPIGGSLLVIAWLMVAFTLYRKRLSS